MEVTVIASAARIINSPLAMAFSACQTALMARISTGQLHSACSVTNSACLQCFGPTDLECTECVTAQVPLEDGSNKCVGACSLGEIIFISHQE